MTDHQPLDHTPRGFGIWADFSDRYGQPITITTSSLATDDCVWIHPNHGESIHLTVEQAQTVRDALGAWIASVSKPESAQPLDLDAIETRARNSHLWIDALQADAIELGGEVRHETRDRGASITNAKRVARWLRDHRADHDALIAEVKRLRGQACCGHPNHGNPEHDCRPFQPDPQPETAGIDLADEEGPRWLFLSQAKPQPDPLDENDHRDRLDWAGIRIIRHGHKHWHSESYELPTPCNIDHSQDPSLEYWTRSTGPLTFADTPQPPQEATSATQTAPDRAALAEVAQAAHKLSDAICDWLDTKEHQ